MESLHTAIQPSPSLAQLPPGRWARVLSRGLFPGWLVLGLAVAVLLMHQGVAPAMAAMAVALPTLALVALMERVMPFEPRWNRSHGDGAADVWSLLIVALGFENLIAVAAPVVATAVYASLLGAGWVSGGFLSGWPLGLQVVVLVLLADLAKYAFHRFCHEHPLGWRLHSVHHAVKRVYWLNGFRIHPLYHFINFCIAVLPWLCLGASAEAVALHTVVLAILAAFQHANVNLNSGALLNHVFNTNELHRWHHSRRLDEANANYGAILVVWDVVFGTYRPRTPGQPSELGMVNEQGYPMNGYFQQLLLPFRRTWWRQREGGHGAHEGSHEGP
jgi:ornithine lipid hydroxylase